MSQWTTMLVYTAASGSCILIGGLAGRIRALGPRWLDRELRHSIIAFGGGVLLAAVALVLVPEGGHFVGSPTLATVLFLLGGLAFFWMERFMGLHKTATPQFSALLLDYLPESLALGGMFASGAASAPLLAVLIGLQNLPEGFNAYRELTAIPRWNTKNIYIFMLLLIPLGPILGTIGWFYAHQHPVFLGGTMLFSSGGIIYLLFQDIAPQSRLRKHWAPALGAVFGFGVGLLGDLLSTA